MDLEFSIVSGVSCNTCIAVIELVNGGSRMNQSDHMVARSNPRAVFTPVFLVT